MLLVIGLLVFCGAAYAISKRYQTTAVLMIAGILLFSASFLFGADYFSVKGFKSTGSLPLDVVAIFTKILSTRIGQIGLIIMSAAGFAKYMDHIGAADAFVAAMVKPLHYLKDPYLLVALAYIFGQIMNIVVPSAAGLGMLLLVTLYPVLRKLGVTPGAAAAAIASASCLDLGPASGNANAAAKLSDMTSMEYFVSYQLPTGLITMAVIGVLFYVTSRYFDRKEAENGAVGDQPDIFSSTKGELARVPAVYAILPTLPLLQLLIFSRYFISSIKLDVVTAMFTSMLIAMVFEFFRKRDPRTVLKDITVFFAGMADMLKSVVMLLVAAEFFASGLQAVGITKFLLDSSSGAGFGVTAMTAVLVLIIASFAFVSGSGNSAFFSFANLAPEVATKMGVPIVSMVMPMQLAAGIFRSMSPVAGVVIAIAGATGVSPLAVVKRTAIPMLGGGAAMFICSQIL